MTDPMLTSQIKVGDAWQVVGIADVLAATRRIDAMCSVSWSGDLEP
jgi:hypothetical protein